VALQQTTRELWASQGPFESYTVHGIPQQNVPEDYIKAVVWKTDIVPNRYYAQSSAPEESGIPAWYPVEFNPEHICWVEICWEEPAGSEGYWRAFRIAGEDLGLDITQEEVESHIERMSGINNYWETITSSPTTRVSTPSEPSIIRPRPSPHHPGSRDQEIAQTLAESLNIRDPMSRTLTMPVPTGTINPITGHVNEDDVALYRAIGPDQADPPSTQGRRSKPPRIPFGWVRPPLGGPPGGFPGGGGGFPGGGGGFPGSGGGFPGGGGPPGGGPPAPVPLPPAPVVPGGRGDKLGGLRDKAEEFITQWQLYEGVNITNDLMRNAYQRAMLFLTYIQGPLVNEWVKGVNAWLRGQVIRQRWLTTDERLWDEVQDSFNRQFANVMEQENAQAKLAQGLKLERGDLDALITEFEQLVRHAGYDINQELVLRVFTSALPDAMYAHIMRGPKPQNYEDWRHAAIEQQKLYTHMKNRADRFKTKPRPPPTNKPWHYNAPRESSNAMDTSPGRTRARIAEAEDFLPGGNRYEQRVGGSREGGYPRGPVQKDGQRKVLTCFFCGKPGHFARDCRQKRYSNQGSQRTNQGPLQNNLPPARTRQTNQDAGGTIRSVVDDRDPQQRATDWLLGVANENDDVKDIVMQELMGREDFQNA
jgi:hypothetical protein